MHERPRNKKFLHPRLVCAVDEVVLDDQIFIKERHRLLAVCQNAADFRSGDKNILRPLAPVEFLHRGCVQQVELRPAFAGQMGEPGLLQLAPDRAADEPAVTGNVNSRVGGNGHIRQSYRAWAARDKRGTRPRCNIIGQCPARTSTPSPAFRHICPAAPDSAQLVVFLAFATALPPANGTCRALA